MTSFYGHLPFSASLPQMGSNEGLRAQDAYSQGLPPMLSALGLGAALQTSSYSPEAGVSPYARGGRVEQGFPLGGIAEALRRRGQEDDTVLAHISPREATFLNEHFGGDINPETGLPQFDFWSKIYKSVKKHVGPVIGTIIGNTLLPGIGGVIGGGIGGSFGHPNDRMGPVKGAMMSQLYSSGLNALGSGANALGMSGIGGSLQSLGGANYLSSLMNSVSPTAASYLGPQAGMPGFMQGIGSFFGGGSGSSAASAAAAGKDVIHRALGASSGGSGLGSFFGGGGGLGSFLGGTGLNNALLATALGGSLLRREKPQGPQSLGEAMREAEKHRWRPDQYPDKDSFRPIHRKYQGYSKDYRPGFDPEEEAFEEQSPWSSKRGFSEGGFLEGYSQGQDDTVPALLSEGEFVIPADVVADLGDGNSKAGARRLEEMMNAVRRHKKTAKHPPQSKGLGAYLNA